MRFDCRRSAVRACGLALALIVFPAEGALRRPFFRSFTDVLVFDRTLNERHRTEAQPEVLFAFAFTNSARESVTIESVRTSCGCTVAQVPELPWTIPPGGSGAFSVVLDARGRRGTVTKSVFVNTSMGVQRLSVRAILGGDAEGEDATDDRDRNMAIALADRSAVFRGECASCHADPGSGLLGVSLYLAVCAICHDSPNRASMVPDLRRLPHRTDRDHWVRWITQGREGSLMPAFSRAEGGPLSEEQIGSLADYLTRTFSRRGPEEDTPEATPQPGPDR